jgi:hypothetical protein
MQVVFLYLSVVIVYFFVSGVDDRPIACTVTRGFHIFYCSHMRFPVNVFKKTTPTRGQLSAAGLKFFLQFVFVDGWVVFFKDLVFDNIYQVSFRKLQWLQK